MRQFPAPRSSVIECLEWLGEQTPYPETNVKGDTFPLTWAADGEIYTSSGDPILRASPWGLDVERFVGAAPDYRSHVRRFRIRLKK